MKKTYMSPTLVEYGRLAQLTLGQSGPDIDCGQGQVNNNNGALNQGNSSCGPNNQPTGS